MSAANCGIILPGHFSAKNFTTLPWDRGRVSCKVWGRGGVVATLQYLFLLLVQKYWCYVHETCYNSHFLLQLAKKTHQNGIFLGFFGENLNFSLFSSKICQIQIFVFLTSLKRHCDVKWRATGTCLVSMERGDSYLSSSTKIIRIRGLIAKI